jgi:hypothetical protein
MSIFGISLLENFGLEFISNFMKELKFVLGNTLDYLTSTHFYKYLTVIFSKKGEVSTSEREIKNEPLIKNEVRYEKTTNGDGIRENNSNSKISE